LFLLFFPGYLQKKRKISDSHSSSYFQYTKIFFFSFHQTTEEKTEKFVLKGEGIFLAFLVGIFFFRFLELNAKILLSSIFISLVFWSLFNGLQF